jgi:hypothetical protein
MVGVVVSCCGMRRNDICLYLAPPTVLSLQSLRTNRNTPRKLVWRAEIVLATADGAWHLRDHAADGHVEADRLALAGAVSR